MQLLQCMVRYSSTDLKNKHTKKFVQWLGLIDCKDACRIAVKLKALMLLF